MPRDTCKPVVPKCRAHILFAWELGVGYGHLDAMRMLAQELLATGYGITFAVRDVLRASHVLRDLACDLTAAPVCSYRRIGSGKPLSYNDLLIRAGYGDARRVAPTIGDWQRVFRQTKAGLLIANHAPGAVLAAQTMHLPTVVFGTGFECPPSLTPLPAIDDQIPGDHRSLRQSERSILESFNTVLRQHNGEPAASVTQALSADLELLCTFPEFDPYAQFRATSRYWGPLFQTRTGKRAAWPLSLRKKIFAYLRPGHPVFGDTVQALSECRADVLLYAPGLQSRQREHLGTGHVRVANERIDMDTAASKCDLAIGHGGHGFTCAMLLKGRPILLLPAHLEQTLTARAASTLGAGLAIGMHMVAADIADRIDELLRDQRYATAAREFSANYPGFDVSSQSRAMANRVMTLERLTTARWNARKNGQIKDGVVDTSTAGVKLMGTVSTHDLPRRFFHEDRGYSGRPYDQAPFALFLRDGISWKNLLVTADLRVVKHVPPIRFPADDERHTPRDIQEFDSHDVRHFHGTVVTFMKTRAKNYGHWMHDILPAIYLVEQMGIAQHCRLHLPCAESFKIEQLEILGFTDSRLIAYEDFPAIRADRLIFVYVGTRYGEWIKRWIRDRFGYCAAPARNDRRVYISRADARTRPPGGPLTTRKVANEAQVIDSLQAYGFEAHSLSGMSFCEQVRLFQESAFIVAPHGSGLMNLHFCAAGTQVIQIWNPASWNNPAHMHPAYACGEQGLFDDRIEIHNLIGQDANGESEPGNIWVDTGELRAELNRIGCRPR